MENILSPLYEQAVAFLKQQGVWDSVAKIYSSAWAFVQGIAHGAGIAGINADTPVLGWVVKFLRLIVDIVIAFIQVFMDIAKTISSLLS
jgi:hypothetical protein